MTDRIKTALERALERANQIDVPREELEAAEYAERGRSIAAEFLRGRQSDLLADLASLDDNYRHHAAAGALETLLNNLSLPQDAAAAEANRRVMEGILALKENKQQATQVLGELEYLFNYYAQAYQQAYSHVEQAYAKRAAQTQEALQRQTGVKMNIRPETQPGFREDLLQVTAQLNQSYQAHLDEHKRRLRSIK